MSIVATCCVFVLIEHSIVGLYFLVLSCHLELNNKNNAMWFVSLHSNSLKDLFKNKKSFGDMVADTVHAVLPPGLRSV